MYKSNEDSHHKHVSTAILERHRATQLNTLELTAVDVARTFLMFLTTLWYVFVHSHWISILDINVHKTLVFSMLHSH